MYKQEENPATLPDDEAIRLMRLEIEVEGLRKNTERLFAQDRTNRVFLPLVTAAFFGFNAFNSYQIWDTVESVERRVAEVTGTVHPDYARTTGELEENRQLITLGFSINPDGMTGDAKRYVLEGRGYVQAQIFGQPGELIGVQSFLHERSPIIEIMNDHLDGRLREMNIIRSSIPNYSAERATLPIVEGIPFQLSFTTTAVFFNDCESAANTLNEIVDAPDLGSLDIRPVFRAIESPPDFETFVIRAYDARGALCEEIG